MKKGFYFIVFSLITFATQSSYAQPQHKMESLVDFYGVPSTQIPDASCMKGHEVEWHRVNRKKIEVLTTNPEGTSEVSSQYQECDSGWFEAGSYCGTAVCVIRQQSTEKNSK
ncbi:hypothetical protein [Rheinheimera sp.]|uniref:hypothetical protein n=1 Tax=Rheinheimera sp. TaxID=1869214 RepID=UPI0040476B06